VYAQGTHDDAPGDRDDMIARARERATGPERDGEWGDKIDTLEDTGDVFGGRYRGVAEDENYRGHGRRVHLYWNDQDEPVWYRGKWGLNREMDREKPNVGDRIVVVVGDAWEGKDGISGFYFGVESEPCSDPLPGSEAPDDPQSDDAIPF
jgi:hypothetical protein